MPNDLKGMTAALPALGFRSRQITATEVSYWNAGENICNYAFILMMMGVFSNLYWGNSLREDTAGGDQGHLALTLFQTCVYTGTAVCAIRRYKAVLRGLAATWPLLLLNLYALMSTLWSIDPGLTLRRSLVLFATTVLGCYFGTRFPVIAFQRLMIRVLFIMVCASLLMLLLSPATVLDQYHSGSFRGLTEHKNIFGEFMGELLLLGLTYKFNTKRNWVRPAFLMMVLGFLLWSRSGTALIALVGALLFLPVLYCLRFRPLQALPLTAACSALLAGTVTLMFNSFDTILNFLGKDRTLTGRAEVWVLVWNSILRRPLLGYGYDAFWRGLIGESFNVVSVVGWQVAHSHNGYLEALLGFGFIGSAIIGVGILRLVGDATLYACNERSIAGFWPFLFLVFYLIHAAAEASFIKRDGISYLLLVVLSTSLALHRKQARLAVT